ncbi:site-specific integrase [Deltaproteobacteria bacterium Smac51]|nr:site-specific integrase [Deltaproteobacteria bacterium Smac51]
MTPKMSLFNPNFTKGWAGKMGERRERTKYQGVYQRRSEIKRDSRDGKIDICYYITYKDKNRKKIWETIGWKSQGFTAHFARDKLVERIQELKIEYTLEKPQKKEVMTFGEAWSIYSEKWLPNLSRSRDEQGRYDIHIAPRFAATPLDQIKTIDLEDFKQELAAKGLSPASIKHVLGNIRRVFNKMVEWELFDGRIPTTGFKMPKIDNARVRYLTPEEAERLMAELKKRSLTWWRIASLSLHTGMRVGEILALTRSDLDFDNGVIHVRFGKTGTRMAHMNDEVKSFLREMPNRHHAALLFPSNKDDDARVMEASKTFSRVVKYLGLNPDGIDERQKVVFHTLRHTFASWLAITGEPLYTISELMGHASLEMTKRYAHLCPDTKQRAVAKIASMALQALPRDSNLSHDASPGGF